MSTNINWARLVEQGRAKAVGVPWTAEEQKAISDGIKPDDVRAGILSQEQLKDEDAKPGKRLERMSLAELRERADALGIQYDPATITKAVLVLEIKNKETEPAQTTEPTGEQGSGEGPGSEGNA